MNYVLQSPSCVINLVTPPSKYYALPRDNAHLTIVLARSSRPVFFLNRPDHKASF